MCDNSYSMKMSDNTINNTCHEDNIGTINLGIRHENRQTDGHVPNMLHLMQFIYKNMKITVSYQFQYI
jgi:hypothetical protein